MQGQGKQLLCLATLLLTPVFASAAEVEVTAPVQVTTVGAAAAYNPTGIVINTAGTNYLYLYTQGGGTAAQDQNTDCPLQGDRIIAYRAPLDANGNPLTFSRVGRVSPCVYDPESGNGMTTPAYFGPGQIFEATINGVTAYHLLADVSDGMGTFHKVWYGWTTDGMDWTWEIGNAHYVSPITNPESISDPDPHTIASTITGPFMQVQGSGNSYPLEIFSPVLLSTHPLTSNAPWWGYFNVFNGQFGVAEMYVDWTSGSPQITYVTDASFDTSPVLTNGEITDSPPVYSLITGGSVKSLIVDAASGETQLWGNLSLNYGGATPSCHYSYSASTVNCNTSNTATCMAPAGCPTAGGTTVMFDNPTPANVFTDNTTGPNAKMPCGSAFNWWAVTRYSIGAVNRANSTVRYMPSGYSNARQSPFRWNSSSGTRYLFSASADNNVCAEFLFSLFYLEYTVESQVEIQ
jgi:hypothetical protein